MILKIEQDLSCQDIEILIRYAKMNKRIQGFISLIQSADTQVRCNAENSVYRTGFRLYQLAEDLAHLGFVHISKSCILNILFGITQPTSGTVRYEENIKVGICPGTTPLVFDRLTHILEIRDILNKFPAQLSGGQPNSKKVVELLHNLKNAFGVTILFTTHNEQIAKTANDDQRQDLWAAFLVTLVVLTACFLISLINRVTFFQEIFLILVDIHKEVMYSINKYYPIEGVVKGEEDL